MKDLNIKAPMPYGLLMLGLISPQTLAIVPPEYKESEDPLDGSIEFGFMYDKGNKLTRSINGRLVLKYEKKDHYKGHFEYSAEHSEDDGETTIRKDRLQLQGNYSFNKKHYLFTRADLTSNDFASFKKEQTFSGGYGHKFVDEKKQKFSVEIGPGYRFSQPQPTSEDSENIREAILRGNLKYEQTFAEHLKFYADASNETGEKNSVSTVNIKLENKLFYELFLVLEFEYKNTKNVPIGTVNDEVTSKLNLKYAF